MSQTVVSTVLAADVVQNGTFVVQYPAGKSRGDFVFGTKNYIIALQTQYSEPAGCSFAYGAGSVTITYKGGTTIPAGTKVWVNMDEPGANFLDSDALPTTNITRHRVAVLDLGAPIAAAATGITTAQLKGAAGALTLDGTRVVNGVAVLDVPRNVTLTVAVTNQSALTFTVTGTRNGAVQVENITGPNANTVQGLKAFDTVTSVTVNGAIATNGVSVGFGNVLGLPCFLPAAGFILKELQDGVAAVAGTVVAGLATGTVPTAINADTRGTYTPNAAPDGSKAFKLITCIEDPAFQGSAQFAG